MIRIVIDDKNVWYRYALECLFQELFSQSDRSELRFIYDITRDNVAHADVIIKMLGSGEKHLCQAALYYRNPLSIVIGICETSSPSTTAKISWCLRDAMLIHRKITVDEFKRKFINRLRNKTEFQDPSLRDHCINCKARALSGKQLEVARSLFLNRSVSQIAADTGVKPKTIYTHKYNLMNRFDLKSNCELYEFLSIYNQKHPFRAVLTSNE